MKNRIVYATTDHVGQIAPLFDAYRVFYEQESDIEASQAFIHERLENQDSVIFLALDDHGRGIGFVQLYPTFSSISVQRAWILADLYVMPYARRQGVAEALMEAALQHAEDTDAKEVQLAAAVDNIPAQRLYEKLGYLRDEDFYHYYLTVTSREGSLE